jgi:hypothetical protein
LMQGSTPFIGDWEIMFFTSSTRKLQNISKDLKSS